MRLFSYVVARDYGFAPNPFYGMCTLATCKPEIRRNASIEDWIVGTGSAGQRRKDFLVYVMQITEAMPFDDYWFDKRFNHKKPNLRGSLKQAFGDNIYHRNSNGIWQQLNSHHSNEDGSQNLANIEHDTQTDRVLIGEKYAYWGRHGPQIPPALRNYNGIDLCAGRGHKCRFSADFIDTFFNWFRELGAQGYLGDPLDWPSTL